MFDTIAESLAIISPLQAKKMAWKERPQQSAARGHDFKGTQRSTVKRNPRGENASSGRKA
jgi:hypothetical protein